MNSDNSYNPAQRIRTTPLGSDDVSEVSDAVNKLLTEDIELQFADARPLDAPSLVRSRPGTSSWRFVDLKEMGETGADAVCPAELGAGP